MKTLLRKVLSAISYPFASLTVLLDESRRINEDGSWDKYHAKKNRKTEG